MTRRGFILGLPLIGWAASKVQEPKRLAFTTVEEFHRLHYPDYNPATIKEFKTIFLKKGDLVWKDDNRFGEVIYRPHLND